jgi:hypothetical protein
MKVGDFVQVITGIGCTPKFGYIRGEGLVSKLRLPVWVVQTAPGKTEAVSKGGVRIYP